MAAYDGSLTVDDVGLEIYIQFPGSDEHHGHYQNEVCLSVVYLYSCNSASGPLLLKLLTVLHCKPYPSTVQMMPSIGHFPVCMLCSNKLRSPKVVAYSNVVLAV